MKITISSFICSLVLSVFAVPSFADTATTTAPAPAVAGAPVVFTGEARKIEQDLTALFDKSRNVNSSAGDEKAKARKAIDDSFDWDKIAELCLGPDRWKKESGSNREQFKKLLKEVIQKTAYGRLEGFWNGANYKFQKIDVKGSNAVVSAEFVKEGETVVMDYKLNKKGRWLIYDLSFEGEDYASNINQQISGFLKGNSFSAFLDKLKKRRDELSSEQGAKG